MSYGVIPQLRAPLQKRERCSGVLSLRHFGLVLFIPWRVGAEEAGAAKDAIMAYGFGGAVADFVVVISGSRRGRDALRYGVGLATTRSQQLAEGAAFT